MRIWRRPLPGCTWRPLSCSPGVAMHGDMILALKVFTSGNLRNVVSSGAPGCLQPVLVGGSHWLQATSGTHFHGVGCPF
jgi:hypothetical protein